MTIDIKPPNGMKTVMCDNKPIGYVEDVGDPSEAVKLAQDLLKSKGLWREITKSESIYNQAYSFANTSLIFTKKT